jgi:hypothetical protein
MKSKLFHFSFFSLIPVGVNYNGVRAGYYMAAREAVIQVIFRRTKFLAFLVVNSGPPPPGPLLHQSRSLIY